MTKIRSIADTSFHGVVKATAIIASLVLFIVVAGLTIKSIPIVSEKGLLSILSGRQWRPQQGLFGFLPFILGTIWVSVPAVVIAVPIALLSAIYLSEYAAASVTRVVVPFIDVLAGIPSVVIGVCGVLVVVPFIRNVVGPAIGVATTGYSVLAGSIVLCVMVLPIIVNLSYEILRTVPIELREASLSLGANKWETIKLVVLRKAGPGVLSVIALGFSRALGETMAVLMVVGNVVQMPGRLLNPAYPLPALIANNYGEMLSIPMYDSALMFASLLLLAIVLIFNIASRLVMRRIKRGLA